ncbi:MAG: polysaccharide deacetylase family protein, partial [Acidobacteriota bacterium]
MKTSRRTRLVELVSALAAWSGLLAVHRWWRRRRGDFRVFGLEYHGVAAHEAEGSISAERFRRHIRWLKRRGFVFDTVAGAARRLVAGDLDADIVFLSFDDGYEDNVSAAFPVLRAENVPASIYLTTGFLDGEPLWFDVARRALDAARRDASTTPADVAERLTDGLGAWPPTESTNPLVRRLKDMPAGERLALVDALRSADLDLPPAARPMSWEQARMLRDAGIELGAHTMTHPILSKLDADAQEAEIRGSRDRLVEELGEPPTTFAVPNGSARDYDEHTLDLLKRLGFEASCTTRRGSNAPGDDPFELKRLGIGA